MVIAQSSAFIEQFLAPFLKSLDKNLFKTGPGSCPTFLEKVKKSILKMHFFGILYLATNSEIHKYTDTKPKHIFLGGLYKFTSKNLLRAVEKTGLALQIRPQ